MKELKESGFFTVGRWISTDTGIAIEFINESDLKRLIPLLHFTVYCFVENSTVLYVAKTLDNFKDHICEYENPDRFLFHKKKINGRLRSILDQGNQVDIYAYSNENTFMHKAAALETTLIETYKPAWNKK